MVVGLQQQDDAGHVVAVFIDRPQRGCVGLDSRHGESQDAGRMQLTVGFRLPTAALGFCKHFTPVIGDVAATGGEADFQKRASAEYLCG